MRSLLGVFGAVGRWPDWERFFDVSQAGLYRSLAALLVCFPALWLVLTQTLDASAVQQGERLDSFVPPTPDVGLFTGIVSAWLIVFVAVPFIIAVLMRRTERLTLWLVARHWALAWLCLALGVVFALAKVTPLPFVVANGALFAAYLGLLPIEIRLAQRAAGFPFMTAILVGCIIISTPLVVLMTGVLLVIQ